MDKVKLKAAFQRIEKEHGAGTVFRLGSNRRLDVQALSTGVLPIDIITGVGGFPRGRIIEVFGPNSGGKTTVTLQAIAVEQATGRAAAFIDAENSLDPSYAKALGVDVDNLIVSQPSNGEQALEVAKTLIESDQFGIVVVDSVSALVPKAELEGDMGQAQMGNQAKLMSQAMRKLNGAVSNAKCCLVFINQIRMKLGGYGNPETTTGGEALKFWASLRLSVRPGQQIKEGDKVLGVTTKIKVVKNKVSPPFREVEVSQIFGSGFEPVTNLFDGAVSLGVITKNGSYFEFAGENFAQGRDNAIESLRLNETLRKDIDTAARTKAFGTGTLQQPKEDVVEEEPKE